MELELYTEQIREVVREGYCVLLTVEVELVLPLGRERMSDFYRRMSRACIEWVKQAEGERLRREFLSREDPMERARAQRESYRLRCAPVFEDGVHAAWECRSILSTGKGGSKERRMAQVWDLSEQTILPMGQILSVFRTEKRPRLSFRPDGVYPRDGELVFYRNGQEEGEVLEERQAIQKKEDVQKKDDKREKTGKKQGKGEKKWEKRKEIGK